MQAPMLRGNRVSQAWVDLSLRTKLLLFALGLITLPGVGFALYAFSGARAALEREVGIQLHETAERGADALAVALARAESDARTWANQDVMRDLLVGDVDKRVSKFLRAVVGEKAVYSEAFCIDSRGSIIAASSGEWMGRTAREIGATDPGSDAALSGPLASGDAGREAVLIQVPIGNPDPPGDRIGSLILVYDWAGAQSLLDQIRLKLAGLGESVAALVVDRAGKVIGGVSFDGQPAHRSALAEENWISSTSIRYGKYWLGASAAAPIEMLSGSAPIARAPGWSVVFVERAADALRAVSNIRRRWTTAIAVILLLGLLVAGLLARQVMRPLDEVTRATANLAANPQLELPLLPVRSRNEVGELTQSFNRMTVELKRSREEALSAAKFAFAGELAAMVAHEVRTPLSVMRSSAQMLADAASAQSESQTELAETIVAEVDRVERVVDGLIQLARPLDQRLEPTPLREILARAADFVAAQAQRQQIRIVRDFADGGPPAACDAEQIYQVVLNLVVNGLQALSHEGTIWLRTLPPAAGMAGFAVADDGPGLPAAIRDRIFLPFVTGREEGTGLGLAFVERIVKAHRGRITVCSESGKGTIFEVRLPIAEGTA